MKSSFVLTLVVAIAIACGAGMDEATQKKESSMQSSHDQEPVNRGNTQIATLGAGCFWCVEAVFQDLKGVLKVESGYAGGHVDNPTYREVCAGVTGHAEVAQVTFDSTMISYRDILRVFFTVHDPTTMNRQGADAGTQYRSAIFYRSEAERVISEEVKKEAQEAWDDPVVTEITPLEKFYKAEDYHQNYYKENPNQPYCTFVIAPKVKKFREKYKDKLKN